MPVPLTMRLTIHSLYSYPVKSCAGIRHDQIQVSGAGLEYDRHWVIVDAHGVFMTQRQHPRMVLIQPRPQADGLWLQAPGQDDCFAPVIGDDAAPVPLSIFRSPTLGADQGDAAAQWLSQFLGVPCRLLHVHPQAHRLASLQHVTHWIQTHPDWPDTFLPVNRHAFAFADGFPFLVTNQHSLDELNGQLQADGHERVDMIRFRPNIVLQGLEPYDEDHLAGFRTQGLGFAFVKPCARCPIPNVDPLTGNTAAEPGRTLARHRQFEQGVLFGVNAIAALPEGEHWLRVGDAIEPEFDF
ncbi:MOSC domain-containing protein [Castellaniella caeni]|uniref:MOSC domain-containing protein n=1 Tax=Castellaniella caeni TaxID=266123 RepID=UPI0009FD3A95|nr:MOSC N-terminal beta barrel domain-containing protein [Castellaniella caeni]